MDVKEREVSEFLSLILDQGMNEHIASLRYASMIQQALMPNPELIKTYLKDYFVMFLPRDIVSGDFYFAASNKQKICIAAADCTGHGVPGALMSILGISFLNEIMQSGISLRANRILNLMREKVMKALNQTGEGADAKDSIDIGLCLIDSTTGRLQYSGANRPLIMIRDGEMTEFKPDKMTIGVAPLIEAPFTNIDMDTKPGDTFYLFTDGFSDQFGEITDKKLKHKNFRRIISSLSGMSMAQQKEHLEKSFSKWKGSAQQIDDVLVFGIQF